MAFFQKVEEECNIVATSRTTGAPSKVVVDCIELSRTTMLRVYDAIVKLLNGSETWTLQKGRRKWTG